MNPQDILKALSTVQDPVQKRDLVSLGYIKDLIVERGKVHFRIQLPVPPGRMRDEMQKQAQQAVSQLSGVSSVEVLMTSLVQKSQATTKGPTPTPTQSARSLIPTVRHVIPVASGKGGVGKSTVSVNLALALAHEGARVGMMDADVYGPTVPTLLGITEQPQVLEDNRLVPLEKHGLKVMSMGFFIKEGEAIVWRGPMLHKTMEQFLGGVVWGDLDYLIIDLPPGTGDIQLSLCQIIPMTGAVIVSTPQDVALNVATKAIFMFNKLNCPVLGIIENMSGEIFGSGGAKKVAEKLGFPFLGEIPLATELRLTSDEGKPIVVSNPNSPLSQAFLQVAKNLANQIVFQDQKGSSQQDVKISF